MDSKERFPPEHYYQDRPIPNDPKYCGDCGIIRTKPPVPGTCPCCFSEMTPKQGVGGINLYICTNPPCKLCIVTDQLSGFWHGWKERGRQDDPWIKNIIAVIKEIQRNSENETDFKLKMINARCLDIIEEQKQRRTI